MLEPATSDCASGVFASHRRVLMNIANSVDQIVALKRELASELASAHSHLKAAYELDMGVADEKIATLEARCEALLRENAEARDDASRARKETIEMRAACRALEVQVKDAHEKFAMLESAHCTFVEGLEAARATAAAECAELAAKLKELEGGKDVARDENPMRQSAVHARRVVGTRLPPAKRMLTSVAIGVFESKAPAHRATHVAPR